MDRLALATILVQFCARTCSASADERGLGLRNKIKIRRRVLDVLDLGQALAVHRAPRDDPDPARRAAEALAVDGERDAAAPSLAAPTFAAAMDDRVSQHEPNDPLLAITVYGVSGIA